jgi:hypothetical protein
MCNLHRGTWGNSLRGTGKDEDGHDIGTHEAGEGQGHTTSNAQPPTVTRQPPPATAAPDVGLAWGGAGLPQRIQVRSLPACIYLSQLP